MIDVKMDIAKKYFFRDKQGFDKQIVIDAVGKATADGLSKAGSMVWRKARDLIKPGKKPSKPDKPPKSHSGLLRDNIMFMFSPQTKSVLIGPTFLERRQDLEAGDSVREGSTTVPRLLEFGGKVKMKQIYLLTTKTKRGKARSQMEWVRHTQRRARNNPNASVRVVTAIVHKRPYMAPALANKQPQFAKEIAKAISKSFRESRHKYGT